MLSMKITDLDQGIVPEPCTQPDGLGLENNICLNFSHAICLSKIFVFTYYTQGEGPGPIIRRQRRRGKNERKADRRRAKERVFLVPPLFYLSSSSPLLLIYSSPKTQGSTIHDTFFSIRGVIKSNLIICM